MCCSASDRQEQQGERYAVVIQANVYEHLSTVVGTGRRPVAVRQPLAAYSVAVLECCTASADVSGAASLSAPAI